MVLSLLCLWSLRNYAQSSTPAYHYEIYTQPTCTYCPKEADFRILNSAGWGKYIIHYSNGDTTCTAYPTFRVRYGEQIVTEKVGYLSPSQIGDFFNQSYYGHYLASEYAIETKGMTLSQLESINKAILRLRANNVNPLQNR